MILSVIIPVYKTEKNLERCVQSVLDQDIEELEVILVDDESPDRSPELCDILSERDSRVKAFHKRNGGLSDARNAGLNIASGKYVAFVDSDDFLLPVTYKPLLQFLQKNPAIDILEFNVQRPDADVLWAASRDCVFTDAKEYWLSTKAWRHAYAWNKIYRRNLFDKCHFPKDHIFEDMLLLPDILKKCKNIATLPGDGAYIYTFNPDGISRQITASSVSALLRAEAIAAWKTKTAPWSRAGRDLYRCMLCRVYDIIRLSFKPKVSLHK